MSARTLFYIAAAFGAAGLTTVEAAPTAAGAAFVLASLLLLLAAKQDIATGINFKGNRTSFNFSVGLLGVGGSHLGLH